MAQSVKIECVGGLWDARMLNVEADEFGRLPGVMPDSAGKPFYSLLFDQCVISQGNRHEYTGARYVPASA